MTVGQIVDQVCIKTHDTSAGAVAAATTFASNRYEMIWNSQIWQNSLITTTQNLAIDDSIITIADSNISLPIAVKIDDRSITPSNYESAFMNSPDAFSGSGEVTSFVILSNTAGGLIRIQLLKAVSTAGTISILGKTKVRVVKAGVSYYRSLTDSDDETAISGLEQPLIAFVEADMLEFKQAYAKAAAKQAEAMTLLALARNMERSQSASRFTIAVDHDGQWGRDDWDVGTSGISFSD